MLNIHLLGPTKFQLSENSKTQSRKSLSNLIIVYLIRSKEPVSRKRLSKLFWPHLSDQDARTYLRNILARLKEQYAQWLIADRVTLTFNLNHKVWVDLIELEAAIAAFGTDSFSQLNETHAQKLNDALNLYTGSFLENYSDIQQPMFADWVDSERRAIQLQVVQAYADLTQYHLLNHNFLTAIKSAEKGISINPSTPNCWPLLMKGQVGAGDVSMARSTYQQYIELGNEQHCEAFSNMVTLNRRLTL